MNKGDIQQLYQYNKWANGIILNSVAPLRTEELTRHLGGSFPSLRDTLVHIMSAEWIWLRRWKGVSPRAMLEAAEFADIDAVRARWSEIETEQMAFVQEVTNESLHEIITYTNTRNQTWRYPLGQMMQHLVNHSTYHRGQITNFLRQLGAQPVATDFLIYLDVDGSDV
ncbi:MAG: damage-inducible protein DinB [Acidobacteria bacterium]|nr:MAG: damage-inducible protein DinB [Acidobacteriota bacterium]